MKDLQHLAEEHKIQSKLYHGDGLDRIYQLLGDTHVRKWLSKICEESYDDQELWSQMINILEKDLKVHQQKVLIQEKVEDKKSRSNNDGKNGKHAHLAGKPNEIKCYFCDETEDHVPTNGPRGTQIAQYFACKKDQHQPADYQHTSSTDESAIYILQTIKVEKQLYSLFYDTGCCDMVSRYQAVKSIGARASKEISGPISVGDVGNSQIQTNLGIYKVQLPLFNGSEANI